MSGSFTQPTLIAGYQGTQSILTRAMQALADEMGARDVGWQIHAEVNVTPSGETAASLFGSVDTGVRQVCYMASGYLTSKVPELAALDLPFCITDRRAALDALDGTAGAFLAFAVEQRTGYKLLGYWDNGFRHVSNGVRSIRCAGDAKDLTIRTLDSAVYRDSLAAMGFQPRSIDVKDLIRVVQTREVDAQENPLTNLVNFGLWRHHPYVSLTGHFFGVVLLVCNKNWFAGLSGRQQESLLNAARHATSLQRKLAASEDHVLTKYLVGQGVEVLQPRELDVASMRRATRPIVERERKALPPQLVHAYLEAAG